MVEFFAYIFLMILVYIGLFLAAKTQFDKNRREHEKKIL
tara:strand:- start:654 stop:770 length:117 start_codon:yes stop_codon:yes gene_type:complete